MEDWAVSRLLVCSASLHTDEHPAVALPEHGEELEHPSLTVGFTVTGSHVNIINSLIAINTLV